MEGAVLFGYVIAAILFGTLPFAVYGIRAVTRPYGALVLFSWIFALSYFVVPTLAAAEGRYWHQTEYSAETMLKSLLWFVVFGLSVYGGFMLTALSMRDGVAGVAFDPDRWKVLPLPAMLTGMALMASLVIAAVLWFLAQIAAHGLGAFLQNRIQFLSGLGYLSGVMLWPMTITVIAQVNARAYPPGWRRNLCAASAVLFMLLAVLAGMMTGSRTTMLTPVVLVVVVAFLIGSRGRMDGGRLLRLAGLGLAVLLLGVFMGRLRENIFAEADLGSMGAEGVSVSGALVSAYGEYENLWWMVENESQVEFLHGRTFLAAAVGFVPRRIWPAKPLGGGPYLTNMIYPGDYDLTGGWNLTSFTTGLVAETFHNFGRGGLVLVGVAFGILLGLLDRLRRRVMTPLLFAVWIVLLFRSILALKAEVFGNVATTFSVLTPVVILWVCTLLFGRWTTARSAEHGGHGHG